MDQIEIYDDYSDDEEYEDDYEDDDYDEDRLQDGEIGANGKPVCNLVGTDGNAFALMGKAANALKRAGLGDQVNIMTKEAMSGDYNHLLRTLAKYCDVR